MTEEIDFDNFRRQKKYCLDCVSNLENFLRNPLANFENEYLVPRELIQILVINDLNDKKFTIKKENIDIFSNLKDYLNLLKNDKFPVEYFSLCKKCQEKVKSDLLKDVKEHYYKSDLVSNMFNYFLCDNIKDKFKEFLLEHEDVKKQILMKLIEFRDDNFKSSYWKGSNYYLKEITGIPGCFFVKNSNGEIEKISLTAKIYQQRKNMFLEDYICGHPMASNGWYKESLEKTESLGCFL